MHQHDCASHTHTVRVHSSTFQGRRIGLTSSRSPPEGSMLWSKSSRTVSGTADIDGDVIQSLGVSRLSLADAGHFAALVDTVL